MVRIFGFTVAYDHSFPHIKVMGFFFFNLRKKHMGMLNIIDVSSARAQNAKTGLTSNV